MGSGSVMPLLLIAYALSKISAVKFIVEQTPDIPVIVFTIKEHHNHDIATPTSVELDWWLETELAWWELSINCIFALKT